MSAAPAGPGAGGDARGLRVLVTGAAGFLGSHVVAALRAAGHAASGLDVAPPGAEALAVAPSLREDLRLGAVTDADGVLDACRGVGAIVHAAGLVGIEGSMERPRSFYETNVMGFVTVCEAARQLGVGRLVLVSSNAVYHGPSGERLLETDPVFRVDGGNPASHYGTSKMMQEAVALSYARSHGLDVTVLRVTAIYGFGMRVPLHVRPMVEGAVLGRPVRLPDGGPMRRDYTFVEDCASAVACALAAPPGGPRVLNASAGRMLTAAAVAAVVRRAVPGADITIGDALTPAEAASNAMRAPLDVAAARAAIGWAPRWSIEDGIGEYVRRLRRFHAGQPVRATG